MSNLNNILNKLSVKKANLSKKSGKKLNLSSAEQLTMDLESITDEMFVTIDFIASDSYALIESIDKLIDSQKSLAEVYRDSEEMMLKIEEIGLEVPNNFLAHFENATLFLNADYQSIKNSILDVSNITQL